MKEESLGGGEEFTSVPKERQNRSQSVERHSVEKSNHPKKIKSLSNNNNNDLILY